MAKKKAVKKTAKKAAAPKREVAAARRSLPARKVAKKAVSPRKSAGKASKPAVRARSYGKQGPKPQGPLVGVRVVELGMIFAGPLTCTLLSDLGADVIKVEHPDGDDVRLTGKFKDGNNEKYGVWWAVTARNKRMTSINVSKPEGAAIVAKIIGTADVFVENFRPGRMKQWGLDYETLSKTNKGLVMLHISGYGQSGPYSRRPGMGTLAEAFSGFAHITGEKNGPPTLPSVPIADGVASITGAYAILAALLNREKTGVGDEIDISLYEPLMSILGSMVIDYDQLGHITSRRGNRSTWTVPRNAYRTKDDKWVAVSSAANSIAPRLFRAIGRPDWAEDPSLATNPQRFRRVDEIDNGIADWIRRHDQAFVLDHFHKADVVAGPINDVAQIFEDPQVKFRETITTVEDPWLGKVRLQNIVPKFTRNPGRIRWLGKQRIGVDTPEVLRELGYKDADIRRLEAEGVIKLDGAPVGGH
jgi:crotonobetainyl-CoA:carnitine CoA-transferase CaiB-like acyl-CoA transferase